MSNIWSYTKLNTIKQCPRWGYKRFYEKAVPLNFEVEEFQRGTEFHELIQDYMTGRITDTDDIPDRIKPQLDALRNEYTNLTPEYKLSVDLYDIVLTGKIDLYTEGVIMEIKNYPLNPVEQVEFYLSLVYLNNENKIPHKIITITPIKVSSESYDYDQQENVFRRTMRRIAEIEEKIEILRNTPQVGAHCYYCPYREDCPGLKVRRDLKFIIESKDGQLLATHIFKLEQKVNELKKIAKEFVSNGIPVRFGNYGYDYSYYEEIEGYDPSIVVYLTQKGVNPFEIKYPRWKKPKKLFNLNKEVLEALIKEDEKIAQFVNFSVKSVFRGQKIDEKQDQ